MKMHNLTRGFIIGGIAIAATLVACQKENSSTTNPAELESFATTTSASDAEAETVFDDVFDDVMGVNAEAGVGDVGVFTNSANTSNGSGVLSQTNQTDTTQPATPCHTVTVTLLSAPNRFPMKIVVDFGTGCLGRDGRIRKGKVITTYTAPLTKPGAVAETSFDGYYVNNIKVEGTHRVENQSSSNVWVFKVAVKNGKLTYPNGNYNQWSRTKTITQIEGLGTPLFPRDDAFSVVGEGNGTAKRDTIIHQWSTRTIEPLIKKFTCQWIVKGKLAVRRDNKDVAVIDYGNGDCDNKATLTVNGISKEIILH